MPPYTAGRRDSPHSGQNFAVAESCALHFAHATFWLAGVPHSAQNFAAPSDAPHLAQFAAASRVMSTPEIRGNSRGVCG